MENDIPGVYSLQSSLISTMPQQPHSGVRRGDIVLVRVSFPHKWWPALVLCTDDLGVLVTFFDHENLSPRYFIETEVISFENNFRLLLGGHKNVDNTETFYGLLDSALKLLGRRVLSSLKCPCQIPRRDESDGGNNGRGDFDGYNSFQPFGFLSFVRKVSVLPWVDALDTVDAIRAVAQVQAFRGYCSIKQKMVYKESRMRGKNVMLHPCSSLDENNSIIQESGALQPKNGCLILSKKFQEDFVFSTTERLNSQVPTLDGNPESFYENQLLITQQTLAKQRKAEHLKEITFHLSSFGLDAFYLLRTFTRFVRQSLLVKNISDQCFYFPGNKKIQLSGYVSRRERNSEELCLNLPDGGSGNDLTRKRGRLDELAPYDYSFKMRRIVAYSSTSEAYLSPRKKEDISSTLACCLANSDGKCMEFFQDFQSQSPVKLTIQDLCSNRGLSETYTCQNSRLSLPDNESSCVSLLKDASYCVGFPEIDIVQGTKRNTAIKLSCIKMLDAGESNKQDNESCILSCETKMNLTDGVHNGDTEKSRSLTQHHHFKCESLLDSVLGTHSNNYVVATGAATTKGLLGSCSNDDQIRSQIISNGDTTTKLEKSVGKMSSRSCLMKNKSPHSSLTSNSMFTLKAGQLSKTHAALASHTSLYMKFPKNVSLPTKEELMKKFSVFGTIDSLNTRVFEHTGSAQVAFFQEVDAVAAFSYAKMKKVSFGRSNVQFCLRPFATVSSPERKLEAEGPPVKSCLKNSGPLKKENEKKHHRVSIATETLLNPKCGE